MTYEEYFNAVKDVLRIHLTKCFGVNEDELERYIRSEEEEIRRKYKNDKKGYEEGKYSLNVFKQGSVNSMAWCLYLMYE